METIPAAVVRAAERFGDREAVADGRVRWTWMQLHERVRRCAGLLLTQGIRPGDRVAVCSPNTHHWIVAALGALHIGAVLVPINTRFTGPEMRDILDRTEARALFVATSFLGVDRLSLLRETGARLPATVLPIDLDEPAAWDGDPTGVDDLAAAVRPGDISDILFTSGTTGRSKGAMSAHHQALSVAAAWAECGEVGPNDRYLVINPFFHSFGYKAGILVAVLTGATLLPEVTFDVDRALRVIADERVTVLPGAPTIYQMLLDAPSRPGHDLSSLRLAVTGAATVPVALVERMQSELSFETVLTAYGLTEAVVATMCRVGDDPKTVAHTSGRAAAGCEVRIDPSSSEILLRGPNVMLGYLDDPASTAAAVDSEGWLHTGDVGALDERGYLTITDRIKDMYICGGFNVYPAEVEQTLARLPGVTESAVVGVPDPRLGEVGKAYIVQRARLSAEDVLAHCKRNLANYKVPRQVEFCTELPRNASGKVLKRVLREKA
ncbi:FadD3 family acyl-CoA ligase [Amycolatopsis acidiphila]|uniref:AMP-binding protein n=1 Tax=Amycolatopsis acidiphila TaxID=715473 RepID=A0A558AEZ5_9PSEU|nr:FadD3 family acyl-CoA ligase [Amycolatopsis acidiphila]TVT22822.1 AMP-binding protein [Amycolatopsis acidiphila]UIJ58165.1 FadD3 family acyl-CoA ligase [Amycolatopsis acidiphila]GHG69686.1 acyl-CoA synthetase [Amycolatopsis acidiphila]